MLRSLLRVKIADVMIDYMDPAKPVVYFQSSVVK